MGYNYVAVFIRLAVVASEICEISRDSTKIRIYSSATSSKIMILMSIESAHATSY